MRISKTFNRVETYGRRLLSGATKTRNPDPPGFSKRPVCLLFSEQLRSALRTAALRGLLQAFARLLVTNRKASDGLHVASPTEGPPQLMIQLFPSPLDKGRVLLRPPAPARGRAAWSVPIFFLGFFPGSVPHSLKFMDICKFNGFP